MKAHLFPGQGAQYRGMGRDLFDAYPQVVEHASTTLGYCVRTLCIDDPDKKLASTRFTQPAIFVVNALEHLASLDNGEQPAIYAGHSLGEYNALWAAGALEFESALELVRYRGQIMDSCAQGTMGAVLGWTHAELKAFIAQGDYKIEIANLNGARQLVVAGSEEAIAHFGAALPKDKNLKWVRLDVAGPFHSRRMDAAMLQFCPILRRTEFRRLSAPVLSNVTAKPHRFEDVAAQLAAQINHPVLWYQTMHELNERGVTEFVQTGPGDALERLAQEFVESRQSAKATA